MSNAIVPVPQDDDNKGIKHKERLLETYKKRLRILELQLAEQGMATPPSTLVEVDEIRKNIEQLNRQLVNELADKLAANPIAGDKILGDKILGDKALNATMTNIIRHVDERNDLFTPEVSIIKSKVRYVDAHLAIRYADASQDTNIMLGFFTLFLGAATSFVISFMTSKDAGDTVLFGTALAFSILLTVVFGILTIRSMIKAETTKKLLFESGDLNPNIPPQVK